MDPYKTLGVSRTASQDEIKNVYRTLAKKFHPDLNPKDKSAEHKFKDINAAYEIVGDAANRAKFDRGEWGEEGGGRQSSQRRHEGPFYREARAGGGPNRYSHEGFDEDIFESLFRGGRGGAGAQGFKMAGQDEHYQLGIALRESIEGGERELQLPSGKRLAVKIPPKVVPGQKLRFAGQGGPGMGGGPPGDVFVELTITPDDRFEVKGSSLYLDLPVPLDVAFLGGELDVPVPEGQVRLKIPSRSSSGRQLRIGGKGLFERGGKRGDLLVALQITLPAEEDPDLEAAVKAWRERKERRAS